MYQTSYIIMFFQSCYSLVHFYWIPGANFTLLNHFCSKHLQKLQEIQSLQHVTKHEKRLLLYIHVADCMQKTVNSPTTSVVNMSLFIFLIFSYIFQQSEFQQQAQLSSFPELWRKVLVKLWSQHWISILHHGELYYRPLLRGRQTI